MKARRLETREVEEEMKGEELLGRWVGEQMNARKPESI